MRFSKGQFSESRPVGAALRHRSVCPRAAAAAPPPARAAPGQQRPLVPAAPPPPSRPGAERLGCGTGLGASFQSHGYLENHHSGTNGLGALSRKRIFISRQGWRRACSEFSCWTLSADGARPAVRLPQTKGGRRESSP